LALVTDEPFLSFPALAIFAKLARAFNCAALGAFFGPVFRCFFDEVATLLTITIPLENWKRNFLDFKK
jgi:hypothetical protein